MVRSAKSRRGILIATLIVSFVFLGAVNALSNLLVRGVAIDFTQDKTFTLSEGTLKTLREMQEPVTLRFFYSTKLGETVRPGSRIDSISRNSRTAVPQGSEMSRPMRPRIRMRSSI